MARQGKARQGSAGLGKARQGKAGQGEGRLKQDKQPAESFLFNLTRRLDRDPHGIEQASE